MVYNCYEITAISKICGDVHRQLCHGSSLDDALQHLDFWFGDRFLDHFLISDVKILDRTSSYFHFDEDMLKKAFSDVEETLRRIEESEVEEKEKLIAFIKADDATTFYHLDRECRKALFKIMKPLLRKGTLEENNG